MRCLAASAALLVAACTVTPPAAPAPHAAMPVAASFGRTWSAVIDIFAADNIPIATVDRSSGPIAAQPETVSASEADSLADCGKNQLGVTLHADVATRNVLVRGDSGASTVRANVRFTHEGLPTPQHIVCSSRAVWETTLEQRVKVAAEGHAVTQSTTPGS